MILNLAQAEAAYSAMCALNNVTGTGFKVTFHASHSRSTVRERGVSSRVLIERLAFGGNPTEQVEACESYEGQNAFATASGCSATLTGT